MTSEQLKHLDYIQSTINRMADNSFKVKGWMVTLISALMALYVNTEKISFLLVAFIPMFVFWFLDAYYLQQERKFRGLYDDAVAGNVHCFSMTTSPYDTSKYSFASSFWSKTICPLYGTMVLLNFILLLIFLLKEYCCCCN